MPEEANSDMITNYTMASGSASISTASDSPAGGQGRARHGIDRLGQRQLRRTVGRDLVPDFDRVCTWHSQEVVQAADSELGYANTLAVARAMALTGLDLIVEPDLLAAVKEEFNRAKAARAA